MKKVFRMSMVLAVLVSLFTGCPDGNTVPEQVAAPTTNLAAGAYTGARMVTFATTTAGANIYYTINGTTPTTSSTKYTTPFAVYMETTLKAIAVKAGMTDSEVLTAAYTSQGKSI